MRLAALILGLATLAAAQEQPLTGKIPGYRGIWFELGQVSEFGDKYSGGLGTYTAKHHPLAVYAPEVDKTFFVYGGTTAADERHLLAMASYYDHAKDVVPQPTIVHDKLTVDDPHDNPSLNIDNDGYLWVFVSGRAQKRPGFIYRSKKPYDVDEFELVREWEMTYPQPWAMPDGGFLLLFTRYTNGRELYWSNSADGREWSDAQKLAAGGHYQMSNRLGNRVVTAFNVHTPPRNVDSRSNLYFAQTEDGGRTWTTVEGRELQLPLERLGNPALVRNYKGEGRRVYLKDVNFDADGHPVLLIVTSADHRPGPAGEPRFWEVAHWSGKEWRFRRVGRATHNYDMGSLYVEGELWRVVGPLAPGPQYWGTGGEIGIVESRDAGLNWGPLQQVTAGSDRNHGYVRRPVDASDGFHAFWADGNPDELSQSKLYFMTRDGKLRVLPYTMSESIETPLAVGP